MDRPLVSLYRPDVPADNGNAESPAGIGNAFDGQHELPHNVLSFGISEIQAIRNPDGLCPGAREVPGRFRYGQGPAHVRVQETVHGCCRPL